MHDVIILIVLSLVNTLGYFVTRPRNKIHYVILC